MPKASRKQIKQQIARMNRWTFGEFIKSERMARGLSRREMAVEIGFSAAQLQNYEHGSVVAPKLVGMMKIADAIGVGQEQVFNIFYPEAARRGSHENRKSSQKG